MRNAGSAAARNASLGPDTDAADGRRYHHGDLSRALVQAGRRILETDGPSALSLRAVAREAGVSPAAPYHHFKDKGELLDAVAQEGWRELGEAIGAARVAAPHAGSAMTEIGVAYVRFARENPAIYRIMYDGACEKATMPDHAKDADSGWGHVALAVVEAGADPEDERDMMLTQIAAWATAHGVAEMAGFKEFEPLKEALGGEEDFVRALLGRVAIYTRRQKLANQA